MAFKYNPTTGQLDLVGAGSSGASWGSITGLLSDQVDLKEELVDLIPGNGSYYFTNTASDLGAGLLNMVREISPGGVASESFVNISNGDYLSAFCTALGFPDADELPAGPLSFAVYAQRTAGTKPIKLFAEFYVRTVPGAVETLIGTSLLSEEVTNSSTLVKAYTTTEPVRGMNLTDRLVVRIRADVGSGTNTDIDIRFQGSELSRSRFPLESGAIVKWGDLTGTLSDQTDLQAALNAKQNSLTGNANSFVGYNSSGLPVSITGHNFDPNNFGSDRSHIIEPNNLSQNIDLDLILVNVKPLQNSPNDTATLEYRQITVDPDDTGFGIGTSGNGVRFTINNAIHNASGNLGSIAFIQNDLGIGNGTDPISVKGISYIAGQGTVNANVTINGPILGYGFGPNVNAAAIIHQNSYIQGFLDTANFACEVKGYASANFSPNLESIANNNNYTGLNINPDINTFTGNAGFVGVYVGGILGAFNANGYYQGVNVNPTITSARYAAGLQVTMDGVTPFAGVQASIVFQDLTLAFNEPGTFSNSFTIEYTPGATAGSEVVSVAGFAFEVQIESGVSTAAQIKAALEANPGFAAGATATISGVGSNAQVTAGPTNFSGGQDAGRTLAAFLDGDVEITGALLFNGNLNSFASATVVNGGGQPSTIHNLVTQPTVAANITIAGADTLGVNTAMLLNIGTNATVSTGLTGISSFAAPVVSTMGAGSTLDRCAAGTFVLSLDATSTGGTIDIMDLCRAIAIPNGVTAINKLRGYTMDLPFGNPGTDTWGFYESPGVNNYFQGNLLIGGAAGSDDIVTNASVALEIKSTTKAFVLPRMTTTEKNALTAIEGMYVYDLTLHAPAYYDGTVWV